MKKNEYKLEVDSLRLSDEFKESLKAKMLEEYNKREKAEPKITMSGAARFSKKYAKFAAIAAALVIVASTAGVIGIRGLKSKSADNTSSAETAKQAADSLDADSPEPIAIDDTSPDDDIAPANLEEEFEESYDAQVEAVEEDPAESDDDTTDTEYDTSPAANYAAEDAKKYSPYASTNYDGDYNGDDYINTDTGSPDGLNETNIAENIYSLPTRIPAVSKIVTEPDVTDSKTAPAAPNPDSFLNGEVPQLGSENPTPSENVESEVELDSIEGERKAEPDDLVTTDEENSQETESPSQGNDSTLLQENEESLAIPVEDSDNPPADTNPCTDDEITQDVDEALANLATNYSLDYPDNAEDAFATIDKESPVSIVDTPYSDYYDYRNNYIGEGAEIGIIRFTIEKSYSESELPNAVAGIMMDSERQTLYKVNVTYDYLNSASVNITKLLMNVGTYSLSLDGEPIMSGEYIAKVDQNDDGILVVDQNLLYKIYNINGLDIAYHVVSPLGNNIDPGDTNMGLSKEESSVYTTSANNPERYVHKAAVSELTRYLKRNLARLNVLPIDLSSGAKAPSDSLNATYSKGALNVFLSTASGTYPDPDGSVKMLLEEMGAEIGIKTCSVITKDGSKAHFKDGVLTGIDIVSYDKPFYFSINGVTVGTDKETALELLNIEGALIENNAEITLIASEEDGGWTATLKFENGYLKTVKLR